VKNNFQTRPRFKSWNSIPKIKKKKQKTKQNSDNKIRLHSPKKYKKYGGEYQNNSIVPQGQFRLCFYQFKLFKVQCSFKNDFIRHCESLHLRIKSPKS